MNVSITFSGPAPLISAIAEAAAQIHSEFTQGGALVDHLDANVSAYAGKLVFDAGAPQPMATAEATKHNFTYGTDGLVVVPEKKSRESKEVKAFREAAEAERARQLQQINQMTGQTTQPVPTEPNALANYQIQQQSQFAQQPVQPGVQFPQPGGFPSAQPAQTAPQQPFFAPQPTAPAVDTTGQAWLNPAAVNQQIPTFEQLNQLIAPMSGDPVKRQKMGEWLQFKGIADFTSIAGQPALLVEAYQAFAAISQGLA